MVTATLVLPSVSEKYLFKYLYYSITKIKVCITDMAKTAATGITRIINAAGYSWLGFKAAFKHEAAFRQELGLMLILTPIALYYGQSYADKAILMASLFFILLVEIVNSAIEAIVDRHGDEIHELSGRAKDLGSAAVFLAFIIAGLVWFSVLI